MTVRKVIWEQIQTMIRMEMALLIMMRLSHTGFNDWSSGNSLRPSDSDWNITSVTEVSSTCAFTSSPSTYLSLSDSFPDEITIESYPSLSVTEFYLSAGWNTTSCSVLSTFSCSVNHCTGCTFCTMRVAVHIVEMLN